MGTVQMVFFYFTLNWLKVVRFRASRLSNWLTPVTNGVSSALLSPSKFFKITKQIRVVKINMRAAPGIAGSGTGLAPVWLDTP